MTLAGCKRALLFLMFLIIAASALPAFDLSVSQNVLGSSETNPFWFQANRWGRYSDAQFQSVLALDSHIEREFNDSWKAAISTEIDLHLEGYEITPRLIFGYGELSWKSLELKVGTFPEQKGVIPHPEFSTGSMAVSQNARALPRVQASMPEYEAVPFTNNSVHVMGGMSHGWFTGERLVDGTVDSTALHEKWGYVKFGRPDDTNLYFGLVHEVMWGGDPVPVNWANFWRVFTGSSGGSDAMLTDQLGESGNTLGIWDLGFEMPVGDYNFHGYYQHYFELKHSLMWRNALDGLWGLAVTNDKNQYIIPDTFVLEYLMTIYQGGPYHTLRQVLGDAYGPDYPEPDETFAIGGGSHQYYSHGVYANGWTHLDRMMGNAMIVPVGEGTDVRIASNRVETLNIAFAGNLSPRHRYFAKAAFSLHRPTIMGNRRYAPVSLVPDGEQYKQSSFLVSLETAESFGIENLTSLAAFAFDVGDVYDNTFGFEIGLKWNLY